MCCEVDILLTHQLMDSLCTEAPELLQESLHHHDLVITINVLGYFDCSETIPPSKDSIPSCLQGVASRCKMTILSRAQIFRFVSPICFAL